MSSETRSCRRLAPARAARIRIQGPGRKSGGSTDEFALDQGVSLSHPWSGANRPSDFCLIFAPSMSYGAPESLSSSIIQFCSSEMVLSSSPHHDCCDARAASGSGHFRPINDVCAMSAFHPIATELLHYCK